MYEYLQPKPDNTSTIDLCIYTVDYSLGKPFYMFYLDDNKRSVVTKRNNSNTYLISEFENHEVNGYYCFNGRCVLAVYVDSLYVNYSNTYWVSLYEVVNGRSRNMPLVDLVYFYIFEFNFEFFSISLSNGSSIDCPIVEEDCNFIKIHGKYFLFNTDDSDEEERLNKKGNNNIIRCVKYINDEYTNFKPYKILL
jgi:hypothetical protein